MDHVLVRYGEIGTKSNYVRKRMRQVLRQRVEDKLEYEDVNYEQVSEDFDRIIIETDQPKKSVENLKNIPGIKTLSPCIKTENHIEKLCQSVEKLEFRETFGVRCNTRNTDISSQEVERKLGSHISERFNLEVDLDNPDTWVRVELKTDEAFVFSEKIEGPDGFPVGTQSKMAALISGGIDSPVAAYQMMSRGVDIIPIYFYNKPYSAEDHLLRFESVVNELETFHLSKQWHYYIVDMEHVNRKLEELGKGRMVLHRAVMFRIAEKIAEKEDLKGIITGESLGQKSTQTAENLKVTTSEIDFPVYRPLLDWDKNSITQRSRKLGFFELSSIDSACSTISPDNPSTSIQKEEFNRLKDEIDFDQIISVVEENIEKRKI